ncbi:hypothetical protein ACP4OV_016046 [Aristida adscensionis]
MAGNYYTQRMDEVASRLLPPEIVVEIGVADAAAPGAAGNGHAVVEELSAHLIGILGLAGMRSSSSAQHQAPPPAKAAAAAPYHRHVRPPQGAWVQHEHAAAGRMDGAAASAAARSSSRAHAAGNGGAPPPPHFAPGYGKSDVVASCPAGTVKVFASAAAAPAPRAGANLPPVRRHGGGGGGTGVFLPARRHGGGGGTGVFLPRAEVYNSGEPKSSCNIGEKAKPPRLVMQETAMTLKQHEANGAVYQGYPELPALPQEWTY